VRNERLGKRWSRLRKLSDTSDAVLHGTTDRPRPYARKTPGFDLSLLGQEEVT